MMFRKGDTTGDKWREFMTAWDSGAIVEIDHDMADHFMECLPPKIWRKTVKMVDGSTRGLDFGFCEGADRITGFWHQGDESTGIRYFLQHTALFSRGDG